MFKGTSTQRVYEQCLKKGLCKEHRKELNQDDIAGKVDELPRKAFLFIRINILYPLLFKKTRCEKVRLVMMKTALFQEILEDSSSDPSAAVNALLLMDSVIIFTLCQLSTICCYGALFQLKKYPEDPRKRYLFKLIQTDHFEANDLEQMYPVLEENFIGFKIKLIRVCYVLTLLFVRNYSAKLGIKKAIQDIEKDFKADPNWEESKRFGDISFLSRNYLEASKAYTSAVMLNSYSSMLFTLRAQAFYKLGKLKEAQLDAYIAVIIDSTWCEGYYVFSASLFHQKMYKEALEVVSYGLTVCSSSEPFYKELKALSIEIDKKYKNNIDSLISASKNAFNHSDSAEKKYFPVLVDSDSDDSELEAAKGKNKVKTNTKSKPSSTTAKKKISCEGEKEVSDELKNNPCGTTPKKKILPSEEKKVNSETKIKTSGATAKKKIPTEDKKEVNAETKIKTSDATTKKKIPTERVPKLVETSDSEEEFVNKYCPQEKKEADTETKSRASNTTPKKKRTTSEKSSDIQPVDNIRSFLKDASEAILSDCGYKAIQIFRGPLKDFIECFEHPTFEECDIVCIKYSYALAYFKSGGYDDLLKCITTLKEIINKHDSVTFPAAYYALGLAYQKLNRFKEALNYLETVKNFLCKGIHFKVYPWPGVHTVIQETKFEILKALVDNLIGECENPPNPDAICRFANCSFQPTIYYTHPDFKGYISVSCSEHCCLQYHLQCWKLMKTERDLTDKEFLEQDCFTPDCEGAIFKIQNIDRKGDISKEFTSEFKKPAKPKWAKWEKKDPKEKRKKRTNSRSDDGSQENSNECGKASSRRNSDVNDKSVPIQISGLVDVPAEKNASSTEIIEKTPEKEAIKITGDCKRNGICSSSIYVVQETPILSVTEQEMECDNRQISDASNMDENEFSNEKLMTDNVSQVLVSECIKDNAYSYLSDFLLHHGPLRSDDPLLVAEIASFPEDVIDMIDNCGGIGEFLKSDLRFGYVANTYVCAVSDLAEAYKINNNSLTTNFESLQSLDSVNNSEYYAECNTNASHHNFGLNPDALEYTPVFPSVGNNKDANYKSNSDNSTFSFLSENANVNSKSQDIGASNLSAFQNCEISLSKSKSCDTVLSSKFSAESISSTYDHDKQTEAHGSEQNNRRLSHGCIDISKPTLEVMNSDSNVNALNFDQVCIERNGDLCSFDVDSLPSGEKIPVIDSSSSEDLVFNRIQAQLLPALKEYCSENFNKYHQYINVHIKPYVIRKLPETATSGTETDVRLCENTTEETASASVDYFDDLGDSLAAVNKELVAQNVSLEEKLSFITTQNKELSEEVSKLKSNLASSSFDLEVLRIEHRKKEEDQQNGRKYLLQSLSDAHGTIDKLKKHIADIELKNKWLTSMVDKAKITVDVSEAKMKSVLEAQDKRYSDVTKSLQKENDELKNRTKHAELQVLHFKKSQYVNRVEDKCLEASKKRKELTDGLSIMSGSLNPVLQTNMKTLSSQLSFYISELNHLKQEFLKKIDEQVEKVEKGISLNDLEEIKMKDFPDFPTWKNGFPASCPTSDKFLNSSQAPFNFVNSGIFPQIPTATVIPPSTSATIIPPAAPATITLPAAPATITLPSAPATITPSVTPAIIPQAASSPVPPAAVIPPSIPVAAVIPPVAQSVLSFVLPDSDAYKSKQGKNCEASNILNPQIQESFNKSGSSLNSFTNISYSMPVVDNESNKTCSVLGASDPVLDNKLNVPKGPPGIMKCADNSLSSTTVRSSRDTLETFPTTRQKVLGNVNSASTIKLASVQNSLDQEKKKSNYEKLLGKLKERFPSHSQMELVSFVKEFRAQREGKLSGLTIETIINEISAIIRTKNSEMKKDSEQKVQPKSNKVLVNKKLVPDLKPPVVTEQPSVKKKSAWGIVESDPKKVFSGSSEDDCTICCEPMSTISAYKVQCGHAFHEQCIREWLKNKSNCPVCRVLLLLPEEYPDLS